MADRVAPYSSPPSDAGPPPTPPPRASAVLAAATQKLLPRPRTATTAGTSKWGAAAAQATAVSRSAHGAAIVSIEDAALRGCAARLLAAQLSVDKVSTIFCGINSLLSSNVTAVLPRASSCLRVCR